MIVEEMCSTRALIEARSSFGDHESLKASYANSMAKQLSHVASMGAADGKRIIDELKRSPYGEASTGRLLAIIDDKLQSSTKRISAKGRKKQGGNTCQFLHKWWNFFTQQDWDYFRNPKKTLDQKMTRGVFRANRLGVNHPDEQALRWLLALLLIAHCEDLPSNKEIFKKLTDLKSTVTCERKSYLFEVIYIYPDKPDELSAEMFEHAYDKDDPPIIVDLHGINTVADRIALRKNSALLDDSHGDPSEWRRLKAETAGSDGMTIAANGKQVPSLLRVKPEPSSSPCNLDTSPGAWLKPDMPNVHNRDEYELYAKYKTSVTHDEMPKNEAEQVLYSQYKSELWKLRARSAGVLSSPGAYTPVKAEPAVVPEPIHQLGLTAKIDVDGSLLITPRELSDAGASTKSEGDVKAETAPVKPADSEHAPTFDDLDAHSKASILALKNRNVKKKQDAAQKHAVAKQLKGKRGAAQKEAMKRPACSAKSELKVKREAPIEVDNKNITKAMPKDDATTKPIWYNGGIVYTVHKSKKFRALRVRGDNYTESSASWGKSRTKSEAWSIVIRAIDKHAKGKAKA